MDKIMRKCCLLRDKPLGEIEGFLGRIFTHVCDDQTLKSDQPTHLSVIFHSRITVLVLIDTMKLSVIFSGSSIY